MELLSFREAEPCGDPLPPWCRKRTFDDPVAVVSMDEGRGRPDGRDDTQMFRDRAPAHPKQQHLTRPVLVTIRQQMPARPGQQNFGPVIFAPIRAIGRRDLGLCPVKLAPDAPDQTQAIAARPRTEA